MKVWDKLKFAHEEMDWAVAWHRGLAKLELPVQHFSTDDNDITVRYTPLGVVVGVVPWNYPVMLAAGKIVSNPRHGKHDCDQAVSIHALGT